MRLLVVEDDPKLGPLLVRLLKEDRHLVELAQDGATALELLDGDAFELVILDVGLPDMSGLEVARRVRRARSPVAILVLTARDTIDDRVTGLDAGADDYLVKPFAYQELSARLRALSRRSAIAPNRPGARLENGPILLEEDARRVSVDGRHVSLSPREFSLLESFLRHGGQVLTRDQLLDQAWPYGVAVTPNSVDAYVHYLRTKLGGAGDLIETVRSVGYRMRPASSA
ncbi:MAG: response regulator transcription factor [Chloroflexota bacterium]|nr:response regulator transcription factor [Chloroflexota bacterium]PZR64591.1 MAG: DNA-binding response regulator [Chloroflexota bacterium]